MPGRWFPLHSHVWTCAGSLLSPHGCGIPSSHPVPPVGHSAMTKNLRRLLEAQQRSNRLRPCVAVKPRLLDRTDSALPFSSSRSARCTDSLLKEDRNARNGYGSVRPALSIPADVKTKTTHRIADAGLCQVKLQRTEFEPTTKTPAHTLPSLVHYELAWVAFSSPEYSKVLNR